MSAFVGVKCDCCHDVVSTVDSSKIQNEFSVTVDTRIPVAGFGFRVVLPLEIGNSVHIGKDICKACRHKLERAILHQLIITGGIRV